MIFILVEPSIFSIAWAAAGVISFFVFSMLEGRGFLGFFDFSLKSNIENYGMATGVASYLVSIIMPPMIIISMAALSTVSGPLFLPIMWLAKVRHGSK